MSTIRANSITNSAGTGAPDFPNGLTNNGVTLAGVPSGAVAHFAMNTAPTGWLKANGALVSRTTYANLFAAIGTTFGAGDGSTTFALPDLRGEFLRGWDDGRSIDSSRAFGSSQASQMQSHNHISGHKRASGFNYSSGNYGTVSTGTGFYSGAGGAAAATVAANTSSAGGTENSSENRPRNIALLACIKF